MASKGLRDVSPIKLHKTLKRATNPRIPPKPLLAITVCYRAFLFNYFYVFKYVFCELNPFIGIKVTKIIY